jgi:hypothetical protein
MTATSKTLSADRSRAYICPLSTPKDAEARPRPLLGDLPRLLIVICTGRRVVTKPSRRRRFRVALPLRAVIRLQIDCPQELLFQGLALFPLTRAFGEDLRRRPLAPVSLPLDRCADGTGMGDAHLPDPSWDRDGRCGLDAHSPEGSLARSRPRPAARDLRRRSWGNAL